MFSAKLIRSANPLFKDKDSRIYEKPGGFTQALDDFDRLHATNVKRTGVSDDKSWRNICIAKKDKLAKFS